MISRGWAQRGRAPVFRALLTGWVSDCAIGELLDFVAAGTDHEEAVATLAVGGNTNDLPSGCRSQVHAWVNI
jgi:hypothetical protein